MLQCLVKHISHPKYPCFRDVNLSNLETTNIGGLQGIGKQFFSIIKKRQRSLMITDLQWNERLGKQKVSEFDFNFFRIPGSFNQECFINFLGFFERVQINKSPCIRAALPSRGRLFLGQSGVIPITTGTLKPIPGIRKLPT